MYQCTIERPHKCLKGLGLTDRHPVQFAGGEASGGVTLQDHRLALVNDNGLNVLLWELGGTWIMLITKTQERQEYCEG